MVQQRRTLQKIGWPPVTSFADTMLDEFCTREVPRVPGSKYKALSCCILIGAIKTYLTNLTNKQLQLLRGLKRHQRDLNTGPKRAEQRFLRM